MTNSQETTYTATCHGCSTKYLLVCLVEVSNQFCRRLLLICSTLPIIGTLFIISYCGFLAKMPDEGSEQVKGDTHLTEGMCLI